MAVTIRLKRTGSKKRSFYHFVVTDTRARRDSNAIEKIGTYNPLESTDNAIFVEKEKAEEWLKKGVQMSQTVQALFFKAGVKTKL